MHVMKKIGKGTFSNVYLKSDNKTVFIKSVCLIKECMALGWFPNSRLFPKLKRVGCQCYEMKYYPRVKSLKQALKPSQYLSYKQLREAWKGMPYISSRHNSLDTWRDTFEKLENKRLSKIMLEALDGCANYGNNIGFEISPRNVAVTESGNLILLDVFYDRDKLIKVRKDGLKWL